MQYIISSGDAVHGRTYLSHIGHDKRQFWVHGRVSYHVPRLEIVRIDSISAVRVGHLPVAVYTRQRINDRETVIAMTRPPIRMHACTHAHSATRTTATMKPDHSLRYLLAPHNRAPSPLPSQTLHLTKRCFESASCKAWVFGILPIAPGKLGTAPRASSWFCPQSLLRP